MALFTDRTFVFLYKPGRHFKEVCACFRPMTFEDALALESGDLVWKDVDLFPKCTTAISTRVTSVEVSEDGESVTFTTTSNPRGKTIRRGGSTYPYQIVEDEAVLKRLYDADRHVREYLSVS